MFHCGVILGGEEERAKVIRSCSVTPDAQGPVVKIPTPQRQCKEKDEKGEKEEKGEKKEEDSGSSVRSEDSISMPALKERAQSVSSLSSADSGSLSLSIISYVEDSDINWKNSQNLSKDEFIAQRVEPPNEILCKFESKDAAEPLDNITSLFTDVKGNQEKTEEML